MQICFFYISNLAVSCTGVVVSRMAETPDDEKSARSAGSETHSLLSQYSNTTFDDSDDGAMEESRGASEFVKSGEKDWKYTFYRMEGNLHIISEWTYKSESYRIAVIGPDYLYAFATLLFILLPSIFAYMFLLVATWSVVVYTMLFVVCMVSFFRIFISDPGILRKYNHARSSKWTYCDFCSSFRPRGCVHCSTCKACVSGYDHHCAWTGKCVGAGNMFWFKSFTNSLTALVLSYFVFVLLRFIS